MPLIASDAMRGSPSPRKVLASIPKHAMVRDSRLQVSVEVSSEFMVEVVTFERKNLESK